MLPLLRLARFRRLPRAARHFLAAARRTAPERLLTPAARTHGSSASATGGDTTAEEACATDRWKDASSASCANGTELFDADADADDAVVAPLAISTGALFPSGPGLVFSPPAIDFGVRSVCIPHFSGFNITNNVQGRVVEILSIATGGNPQFIVNKFRPATLAEGESLHVKIIFLPRNANAVTGSLLIKTSVGGFFMAVAGEAKPNRYELVPFTDAELPMGKVYNPPIIVHNPLDVPLQIKEVFTTEKFLHLKLPKGALKEQQAAAVAAGGSSSGGVLPLSGRSARMWTIPPRSSKHIINLSFQSHTPGKYNGYIHVKTDRDHLLIPVAVVVLRRSIYAYPREVDFGSLALGASAHFPISLLNARESGLAIKSVRVRERDPRLTLTVQGRAAHSTRSGSGHTWTVAPRITFAPFEKVHNTLALTYTHPAEANLSLSADHVVRGRIFVVTNQTAPLEIPYTARLLRGSFTVTSAATALLFNVGTPGDDHPHCATFVDAEEKSNLSHTVHLVNEFEVPAKILSIAIAATEAPSDGKGGGGGSAPHANALSASHFVVSYATPGEGDEAAMTIASGDTFPAISISLDVPAALEARRGARGVLLRAELVIETNITSKRIPIVVYDRHLNIAIAADPFVVGNGLSMGATGAGCVVADGSDALDANAGAASCSAEAMRINFGRMATKPEKRVRILNLTNTNPTNVTLRRGNLWKPLSLELINVYSSSNVGGGLAAALDGDDDDDADLEHSADRSVARGGDTGDADADEEGASGDAVSDAVSAAAKAWEMTKTLQLAPGGIASFAVTMHAPGREKVDASDDAIVFVTNTERIAITSQYETVSGKLKLTPSVLVFDPVFPGTVVTKKLFATSTFAEDIKITRVGMSDDRLELEIYKNATMKNGARVGVAQVMWDALANCSGSVLSQICNHGNAAEHDFGDETGRVTSEAIDSMRQYSSAWRKLRAERMVTLRTSITVETSIQRPIEIEVQAVLKRPKVCGVSMKFPLSQVNAATSKHVLVNNPSDHPLAVRLLLPPVGEIPVGIGADGVARPIFHIRGDAKRSAIVPPHSKVQLGPVLFEPAQKVLYESSLYLANNLTRLSRIALSGRGGSGRMVLKANGDVVLSNGRFMLRDHGLVEVAPNSPDGIEFIANASHLVGPLDDGTLLGPSPNGAVAGWGQTRPLRITNNGDLPMTLNSVHIPGGGCEFGGFKIEPCIARKTKAKGEGGGKTGRSKSNGSKKKKATTVRAYTLAPKESYDVWVTFQHDLKSCSIARFRQVLQFDTSLGMQMYPMTVETRRAVFGACEEAVLKQRYQASYFNLTPKRQRSAANVVVGFVLVAALLVFGIDVLFFLRHRAVRAVATSADDVVRSVRPPSAEQLKEEPSTCAQIRGAFAKLVARDTAPASETATAASAAAATAAGATLDASPRVQLPTSAARRAPKDGGALASATEHITLTAAAKRAVEPKASVPSSTASKKSASASSRTESATGVAWERTDGTRRDHDEDEQIKLYVRLLNEGKDVVDVASQMVYATLPKNARTERKIAAAVLASERERAAESIAEGIAEGPKGGRSGSATGATAYAELAAAAASAAGATSSTAAAKAKALKTKQEATDLQREIALLKEQQLAWEAKQRMEEDAKALELDSARVELAKLREQNRLRQVRAEEEAALERRRAQELERKLSKEAKEAELKSQEAQVRAELALAKKRRQLEEEYRLLKLETARFKKLEAEKKAKKAQKRKEKAVARAERAEAKRRAAAARASSLADTTAVDAEHRESILDQLSLIGNVLDDSPPGGRSAPGPSSSASRPSAARANSGGSTGAPSWASDPIPISGGGAGSGAGGADNGWGLSTSADSAGGGGGGSGGGFGLLSDVAPSPFASFGASNVFGNTFGSSPPTGGDAFPSGLTSMGAAPTEPSLAPHWSSAPTDGGSFDPLGSLFSDVDGSGRGAQPGDAGAGDDAAFDPNEFAFDTSTTAFGEGSFFGAMTFDDGGAIEDGDGDGDNGL